MSSALSTRRPLPAEPTVPYPKRATGTSTDAMSFRRLRLHEGAELAAYLLEQLIGGAAAKLFQLPLARVHLGDPLAGEGAVLNLAEHLAHALADVLVDHDWAAGVVAVLGRVRDREAHVREAALPHEVHDQLQLVQALVVGDLGLIAGLDERLEAGANELGHAAAQNRLLAEEVSLGLLREGGLDHPCAAGSQRGPVGEGEVEGATARVLGHGYERGRSKPLLVEPADDVAGPLRRHHDHVVAGLGSDPSVMDFEPVSEKDRGARLQVRRDLVVEHAWLHLVRQQHRDDLSPAHGGRNRVHRQARLLGGPPGGAPRAEADLNLHAGIAQVERVGVPLAAVADDSDFAGEKIGLAFAVNGGHEAKSFR